MSGAGRTYNDAASRWACVGPYYAMFPVEFADEVVQAHTRPGDVVLDPFAGRGTAVYSAATQDRFGLGIEINPVGYVYARAKLDPACRREVELRLDDLGERAARFGGEATALPTFFHRCFSPDVRRFLVAAREDLNWHRSKVDRTLMALLLVHLHGKTGSALSNQMRQTKSMSPQYALRWWEERNLEPPEVDPVAFLKARLDWRYAKGIPEGLRGRMYMGDSLLTLRRLRQRVRKGLLPKANLLFTSPPYCGITNYHYDQWLRLWLLGGPPTAQRNGNGRGGKFEGREAYCRLLDGVFTKAADLLEENATVYVRTDVRQFTYEATRAVLRRVFAGKQLVEIARPMLKPSQTQLFGGSRVRAETNGEVDLVLKPQ